MLEDLSKNELLRLIRLYDKYVIEFFYDEAHEGMIPVCIEEFYNNEYQEINDNYCDDDNDKKTNYYLRKKFIQEFNMERVIVNIMDLCNQEELNDFMIKEFRENIDFKEFREIFDDLDDDEFVDFMEYLGFYYTIEEYNRICGIGDDE